MTCRHRPGDPNCGSHPQNVRAREYEYEKQKEREKKQAARKKERDALTPDANNYELLDFKRIGRLVLIKAKYPNCTLCAHEGTKIMVFPNMSEIEMISLRRIDPHFRPKNERAKGEAPSPIARFPGDKDGWKDAIAFAEMKQPQRTR